MVSRKETSRQVGSRFQGSIILTVHPLFITHLLASVETLTLTQRCKYVIKLKQYKLFYSPTFSFSSNMVTNARIWSRIISGRIDPNPTGILKENVTILFGDYSVCSIRISMHYNFSLRVILVVLFLSHSKFPRFHISYCFLILAVSIFVDLLFAICYFFCFCSTS